MPWLLVLRVRVSLVLLQVLLVSETSWILLEFQALLWPELSDQYQFLFNFFTLCSAVGTKPHSTSECRLALHDDPLCSQLKQPSKPSAGTALRGPVEKLSLQRPGDGPSGCCACPRLAGEPITNLCLCQAASPRPAPSFQRGEIRSTHHEATARMWMCGYTGRKEWDHHRSITRIRNNHVLAYSSNSPTSRIIALHLCSRMSEVKGTEFTLPPEITRGQNIWKTKFAFKTRDMRQRRGLVPEGRETDEVRPGVAPDYY